MKRTLLVTTILVALMVLSLGTVDRSLAYDPGVVSIDWSGDEVNADANPLANGTTPLFIVSLESEIDWSGDEVNADANPLAKSQ
jgi:hypothetical protein